MKNYTQILKNLKKEGKINRYDENIIEYLILYKSKYIDNILHMFNTNRGECKIIDIGTLSRYKHNDEFYNDSNGTYFCAKISDTEWTKLDPEFGERIISNLDAEQLFRTYNHACEWIESL